MRYILLKDSKAVGFLETTATILNTIPRETWDTAIASDDPTIAVGMSYVNGKFLPADPTPANYGTKITVLAFLKRFTDAEAIAIDLGSIGATVQAASLRRYVSMVNAAKFIDLSREDTRAGVIALETNGILTAGRALQILDTPVKPEEVS